METYKKTIEKLLEEIGIKINGNQKHDIIVYDERFYKRVLVGGSLALGETYMEGLWDCNALDEFFTKLLNANLEKKIRGNKLALGKVLWCRLQNLQSRKHSKKLVAKHYDIGNDLYEKMLDPLMMYTCGYWNYAKTLEDAQIDKLELICQKLKLERGMTVLDIGCGWGGFAAYAAEKYQVKVTGITLSKEQAKLAKVRCKNLPVDIKLLDYRDMDGQFDRVLSIGMFEHVGYKNYGTYMKSVNRLLKPDGISLVHTIGSNETNFYTDPWIDKYIFQNSLIPSMTQLSISMEPYFVLEDVHNFGLDYDKTLMTWLNNFRISWPELKDQYDEVFYRMWEYYLNICAASFRTRKNNLWQIVMVKRSYPREYKSIRDLKKVKNLQPIT